MTYLFVPKSSAPWLVVIYGFEFQRPPPLHLFIETDRFQIYCALLAGSTLRISKQLCDLELCLSLLPWLGEL